MEVVYVTNLPSPYRVDFFNELSKYCELTVIFTMNKASNRDDSWYGNKYKFNAIFIENEASNLYQKMKIVIKYLKDGKYIIMGGYSSKIYAFIIAYMKLFNISFILNADGGFVDTTENKVKYLIKKFFISSASYWLSTGYETNKYFLHYGAKEEKMFIYPFTSNNDKEIIEKPINNTEKQKIKDEYNVPYNKVILSIGQFIPRKGFDWMITSYKNMDKDTGIYIVGGNPTDEYLELKRKYSITNLHFIGFQDKKNILNWYKMSDLFVLPTREDIWGLVINEAMSQGIPVITTDRCIAGLELLGNKSFNHIVEVENEQQLLEYTNDILNTKEIETVQNEMLNTIKDYTIENMAKRHFEILKEISNE